MTPGVLKTGENLKKASRTVSLESGASTGRASLWRETCGASGAKNPLILGPRIFNGVQYGREILVFLIRFHMSSKNR